MNDMAKDLGALLYTTFAVLLNMIPSEINEILLFGSLVLGIMLLLGRIYKVHQENMILWKRRKKKNN